LINQQELGQKMSTCESAEQPTTVKAAPRFAFMDATEAAANLRTDRLTILKYIQEGKLRTFGGKTGNPFVRTEDVLQLVQELALDKTNEPAPDPKAVHRNDPVRKLRLRLQQDAKWPEVGETAIRAWVSELDPISYQKMRQIATEAIGQLQKVVQVLDQAIEQQKTGRNQIK